MAETSALLTKAQEAVTAGDVVRSGQLLGPELTDLHLQARESDRLEMLAKAIAEHELFHICMQDPYTKRAFDKPRGYAGDAVMLDYIYRPGLQTLSATGEAVHKVTTQGPMGLSIGYRRSLLQAYIDQTVSTVAHPRILSVASGHCRELDNSLIHQASDRAQYIALDQDSASCEEVRKNYPSDWLVTRNEGIKQLLKPAHDIGTFDLIYSAGLYDYLPDAVASGLTAQLVARLRPGGILLLANFVPSTLGRGYMELVMQWKLIWRTAEALKRVFPAECQAAAMVHLDPHANVAYAQWKKPKV